MSGGEIAKPKLKVGIEIHRQLDTERKLFCSCPTEFAGIRTGS